MNPSIALLAVFVVAAGCAGDKRKPVAVAIDVGQMFIDDLEGRMLRARTARLDAVMLASGAVNASLSARLVLGEGQRARLEVEGTFEGRPVKGWFECDGALMQVGGSASAARAPLPCAPEVRDALVLGFVRMGLLHNAALLVAGEPPDHAGGGAHNWLRAERVRAGEPATHIAFDVVVKREVMGTAVLTLDERALPVRRTQTMRLPALEGGEVKVVETYPRFELDLDVTAVFPDAAAPP